MMRKGVNRKGYYDNYQKSHRKEEKKRPMIPRTLGQKLSKQPIVVDEFPKLFFFYSSKAAIKFNKILES